VLSEVAYYLSPPALADVLDRCDEDVVAGGHVVAVHFRPTAAEHLRDGDSVHEQLRAHAGWQLTAAYTESAFHLDVFTVTSVAATPTAEDGADLRG
jgi:hypothetical protein